MKLPALLAAAVLLALPLPAALGAPPGSPREWGVAPEPPRPGGGRVLLAPAPSLVELADDPAWRPESDLVVEADEAGRVAHEALANGWAFARVVAEEATTVLAEGSGFIALFVNGEGFPGDFYRHGILRLPIPLREGENHLLVRAIRGDFTLRFLPAEGSCSLSPHDALLPDLRTSALLAAPGAVVVLNHGAAPLRGALLEVGDGAVFERRTFPVATVLPHGIHKAPFDLRQLRAPEAGELDERGRFPLPVVLRHGATGFPALLPMEVRSPQEAYAETRRSAIDGSVQYHAVLPPRPRAAAGPRALFLSLHGAGVEALGQARAYAPKDDAFVVAPTNRRRFGFDWQDWGRLDALEALAFVRERHDIDADRVYLTGHSMGGHGAWYLGVLHPTLFAAVAPSAGWASFSTYGGGMREDLGEDPALDAFEQCQIENDTLLFLENLRRTPLYILHGEKDDNVPLAQAELFAERLGKFHRDYELHVEPGAGHWWGSECVDWPPLIDFCLRHVRLRRPMEIAFRTPDPAIAGTCAFATIEAQIAAGRPSGIRVAVSPRSGRVEVVTENVAEFRLDLREVLPGRERTMVVDGEEAAAGVLDREVAFARRVAGGWELLDGDGAAQGEVLPASRRRGRSGPFKLAFDRDMVWVYGTSGTPEENDATLAKVRYDATLWWYRANGSPTVLADREFDPSRHPGRNVVLYGNADTNSAFAKVLDGCPVRVSREGVEVGPERHEGDLALLCVFPRSGAPETLVGVVGATSARSMRAFQHARYFISGTAVPDWAVWDQARLGEGFGALLGSGWFDGGWALPSPDRKD